MISFKDLAKAQEEYILQCRRHLHMHPELSLKEYETTAFIVNELGKLNNAEIQTFEDITGCVATFAGTAPGSDSGRTVLLRADIDALPVQEQNEDLPYCSVNNGVMHACGHDAHTAMLLAAARIINDNLNEFRGNVKLLFQMSEEVGRYSEEYVKRGVLEGVDAVYGSHVWGQLRSGTVNAEGGPRMAGSDHFIINIEGRLSHGNAPHLGRDAILAAAAASVALQSIPSRMNDPLHPLVVTVATMNGGMKENIIADHVVLTGTVRSFDREFRKGMPEMMRNVVKNTVKAYGCAAEIEYVFGADPLINDPGLAETARSAIAKICGEDCFAPLKVSLGAENFSVFTETVPGVYVYIGCHDPEKGTLYSNHHPKFRLDEDVLWTGTGAYVQFAADYLSEN